MTRTRLIATRLALAVGALFVVASYAEAQKVAAEIRAIAEQRTELVARTPLERRGGVATTAGRRVVMRTVEVAARPRSLFDRRRGRQIGCDHHGARRVATGRRLRGRRRHDRHHRRRAAVRL